jgi:hypothetical protein
MSAAARIKWFERVHPFPFGGEEAPYPDRLAERPRTRLRIIVNRTIAADGREQQSSNPEGI